ncbi:MAG: alpha-glucan family phosphorylase, partial [Phaeodactylibacter sp.]|nr:alpha-glucan family phosphorylase [Phaeodactylibacter sp.]
SEITAITNGIHLGTWVDSAMIKAAEAGKGLWDTHLKNKKALIKFIKERNGVELDADKLIIGFAR